MSAIFGLVRLDGTPVRADELARMGRALAHRGPDGQADLALDNAGLGHCLLRVNREDRLEAQPLHDAQLGVTLVADLRLDNREELAEEMGIAPDRLARLADSAVVLEAWRKWGADCVGRLLGDFTLALRDHRQRRLYLARDGMGQRGVYLYRDAATVAFSTEIKALFTLDGVPRVLNEVGLARRLLGPVDPDPDVTLYRGVAVLPGGTLRWYDDHGARGEQRFWQPRAGTQHLGQDDAYYLDAYRRVVSEAIACRVRRLETPPCLLFSGGFDSGTIAAVAAPLAAQQGRAVIAVASVLAPDDPRPLGDARRAVEAFAGRPGLSIHWYTRGTDTVFTDLEQGFASSDECLPTDYFRRAAFALGRQGGARLALDGHGGDYTVNVLDQGLLGRILLRGDLVRFLRELRARRRRSGRSLRWILTYEVLRPLLPQGLLRAASAMLRGMVPQWRLRMSRDDFAARILARGAIDSRRLRDNRVSWGRWRDRWLHLLQRAALGPPAANNLAGAGGLDFSRPFHDSRVVELGLAIPEHLQLRDGQERWLARQALADCLPQSLLDSRPGNAPERPGMHAMLAEGLPAALAAVEQAGPDCPAARYVDLGKVRAALASGMESAAKLHNHHALSAAENGVVVARFVNWFERRNASDQEP